MCSSLPFLLMTLDLKCFIDCSHLLVFGTGGIKTRITDKS
uniref:Uncharacterized protein n=1 Tax=Arundo donax TaxID=35708 RepID=A0A0A9DCD2_ARUDO